MITIGSLERCGGDVHLEGGETFLMKYNIQVGGRGTKRAPSLSSSSCSSSGPLIDSGTIVSFFNFFFLSRVSLPY